MANNPDPYRTLGLSPGASADDIRRAYRRLAKANHPDSAGEKALPRFLAIQAAYESLAGVAGTRRPGARPTGARTTPREPWRPDPERARATREGRSAAGDSPTGRRRRSTSEEPRRSGSGRKRPSNTATPGSTTYDVAEDEPFEPDWSGGTWYGASSGTYWTLNPKEYADPRKHGPEYQRRARRPLDGNAAVGHDEAATEGPGTAPSNTTAGWATVGSAPAPDGPAAAGQGASAYGGEDASFDPLTAAGLGPNGTLLGLRGRFPARIGLALVGWPPIGVAIATIAGEVTGCGRFAATCVEVFGVGTWLAQVAVFLVLLALPSLAALSAVGSLAALAASIPTAVILSASGGSREPAASASILGGVLAVAYLLGFGFALVRRRNRGRVP